MSEYKMDKEMQRFFETEVAPALTLLINGKYRFHAIQKECNELWKQFKKIYHRQLQTRVCDKPFAGSYESTEGILSPFCIFMDNGSPNVAISVPHLKILHEEMKRASATFKQLFETFIVAGYMHELYHLVLELVNPPTKAESLEAEIVVWAKTCENVMKPFREMYHCELYGDNGLAYEIWVKCGRNPQSAQWKEFIAQLYP